jgi:hypothetical protein
MILLNQDLSPFLAAIMVATVAWFFRTKANDRAAERNSQLEEAARLLNFHAETLERFLASAMPDAELKRLLIWFSDSMADRNIVRKLTQWSASRDFARPLEDTEETRHIMKSINFLREHHPDLADDFSASIFSAAAGACLRWPESAAMFGQAFSRIVTTPRRDLVIAITATNLRPDLPFSLGPALTA